MARDLFGMVDCFSARWRMLELVRISGLNIVGYQSCGADMTGET